MPIRRRQCSVALVVGVALAAGVAGSIAWATRDTRYDRFPTTLTPAAAVPLAESEMRRRFGERWTRDDARLTECPREQYIDAHEDFDGYYGAVTACESRFRDGDRWHRVRMWFGEDREGIDRGDTRVTSWQRRWRKAESTCRTLTETATEIIYNVPRCPSPVLRESATHIKLHGSPGGPWEEDAMSEGFASRLWRCDQAGQRVFCRNTSGDELRFRIRTR